MSSGRQSPSPSRQTGPQQSDLPGWSGHAESHNEGASMYNPSAHAKSTSTSQREMDEQKKEGGGSGELGGGVEGLESNPVHPLAEVAKGKIH